MCCGGQGCLYHAQQQLDPQRSAEHLAGVGGGCYPSQEPESGPGVMLDGSHCVDKGQALLVWEEWRGGGRRKRGRKWKRRRSGGGEEEEGEEVEEEEEEGGEEGEGREDVGEKGGRGR